MIKHAPLLMAALVTLLFTVPAAAAAEAPSAADARFVTNAARDGETEVALGKLAAEKGTSEDVKKFGQQMVDDHTKANEELKTLADAKQIDLTKGQEAAGKKTEKMTEQLSKLQGGAFDKRYVAMMVKEHERVAKMFQQQSEKGEDADIKAFAAKTLPALQHHLEMAKELQSKVGKGGGAGSKGGQKTAETEGADPADKPAKEGARRQ